MPRPQVISGHSPALTTVLSMPISQLVPIASPRINELLAREIPQSETAELPGTHSAPRTAKTAFVEQLRAFLARHE